MKSDYMIKKQPKRVTEKPSDEGFFELVTGTIIIYLVIGLVIWVVL